MDYLKFIEAYKKERDFSLFEMVLVATKRAIDLYEGRNTAFDNQDTHYKPVSSAVYEINQTLITPVIKEKDTYSDKENF